MRRYRPLVLAVAVLIPATHSFAQGASRTTLRSGTMTVSASAGTRMMTTAEAQAAGLISTNAGRAALSGGATVRTLLSGSYPVPGLGFDFAHHAALHRNLERQALIDPLTQQRLALAREIRRETPLAPFAPVFFPVMPVIVVQSPPPVIVLQQAAAPEPVAEELLAAVKQIREEIQPPAPPVEPPRVLEEFVLVRRDGAVLYAVAFSAQRERLIYITREGHRRSLLLAELDAEATLRLNEERGAVVRVPL